MATKRAPAAKKVAPAAKKAPAARAPRVLSHLARVNKAIKAAGLEVDGIDGPMVGVLQSLARKMDLAEKSKDGPSLNLTQSYLSATKDLRRASARPAARPSAPGVAEAPASGVAPTSPAKLTAVEETALDRLRREKSEAAG